MLIKLFNGLFRQPKKLAEEEKNANLDKATKLMESGDLHAAVAAYKEHLKLDPDNVGVLNNLGVCLVDIGNEAEANAVFELAYSMDDSYIPGIVNHARMHVEQGRGIEALPFLRQAKVCDPDFTHVDAVYASFCLRNGDVLKARHFQKRAWLANFDKMRYANCHLFYAAYDDIDEAALAAEHRFWAETVRPIDVVESKIKEDEENEHQKLNLDSSRKIRIGYWSPDFRNHSVRYFFRPLLEGHDQSRFDIYLYHDGPMKDVQTEAIEKAGTYFHDVYKLSDADLYELVRSHQLDVLVELAGQSSYNRITLLQQRFATVQMTGLGYPPTVGLSSIDAKVLDRHVLTPESSRYYAEFPLALPSSFWCFDPMEAVPEIINPPVVKNGYVTFGCVGNLAKLNERMLRCWKAIFERVPNCRFLVRSIAFNDSMAEDAVREQLIAAGISIDIVDLCKPRGGMAYFESYGEVDIILDTFPFNGGTTTCSATYMGVPVVSLVGSSLISRMGLSILTNLGIPELAVANEDEYIECAVKVANDHVFLKKFRLEARSLFKQSSLGNGKLFAQEFEQACVALLEQKKSGALAYESTIPILSADELVRRAYATLSQNQPEALQRILNYCLKHYPKSGGVHLLVAQLLVNKGQGLDGAIAHLTERLEEFTPEEQGGALINIARWRLLQKQYGVATTVVDSLMKMNLDDTFDRMQVRLYHACCVAQGQVVATSPAVRCPGSPNGRMHVLIPCDDQRRFDAMREQIQACCLCPDGWMVSYERCGESNRISAYTAVLGAEIIDVLIVIQKALEIHNVNFFAETINALCDHDMISIAGAKRWQRLDWRADDFSHKVGGYLVHSAEQADFHEIQWLGTESGAVVGNLAILDGRLLALRTARLQGIAFDEELLGAELLLEEEWTHTAFTSGLRLAAHRNLGVLVPPPASLDTRARTPGLLRTLEKYGFDPLTITSDDFMLLTAPVASARDGIEVVHAFLEIAI